MSAVQWLLTLIVIVPLVLLGLAVLWISIGVIFKGKRVPGFPDSTFDVFPATFFPPPTDGGTGGGGAGGGAGGDGGGAGGYGF